MAHRVSAEADAGIDSGATSWGFILIYAAAYMGTWLALLTPIMVTLALRTGEIAPGGATDYQLSLVLGVGALFALVGNPLFGWFSDRTISAWGMRRPWLVGGALAGFASLWIVAEAPSIGWLLVGWCLAQLSFNAVLAPLAALLPDQIARERRGTVAGIISICTPLGQIGGMYLIKMVAGNMTAMLMLPAAICLVLVLLLVAVLPDRRLTPERVVRRTFPAFLASFWSSPSRSADFGWVCLGRLFLIMAMSFLMAYQPFLLMGRLGFAATEVPEVLFRTTLVQSAAVVIAGLVTGRLSDITRRRKPFVIGAALACGAGSFWVAGAQNYSAFLLAVALFGTGLGAYLSVDLALITDVLPNKEDDAARDLGLFNIASALPQSIAPAIASGILLMTGGAYGAVFVAAGIAGLCAALAVVPVRSVR
jgi:MFS family permease